MSDSLQPPESPNKSHQLRQRSPKGQRGRPRKTLKPPPPRLSDQIRDVRRSPWFLPAALGAAVLLLALLYSAIRISSRQSETEYGTVWSASNPAPPFPQTRSAVGVEKNGRVEVLTNDQGNRITPSYVGFAADGAEKVDGQHVLDEAVRHALEEAWHLPPHADKEHVGESSNPAEAVGEGQPVASTDAGGGTARSGEEQPPRQRTLQELYADLEELGISAHELEEAWHQGLQEAHER
ncbi:hypothetical protein JCM11251_007062 [Rhodosporidiobolus azoricus]